MRLGGNRIAESWVRINRVLRERVPETAATLAGPATKLEIAELESAIGLKLPDEFRESLTIHNGQNDPGRCHSFVIEGDFATTKQIAQTWQMLSDVDAKLSNSQYGRDRESRGVWWDRKWIPFTLGEGDHLCINLNQQLSATGVIGEIVCHVHDSTYEPGIAASYGDWLESIATKLENGQFTIDEYGYLCPNID